MRISNCKAALAFTTLLLSSTFAYSAGLLKPSNASYQDLQIKTHDVHVIVQDGYSRTEVEQTFFNPNQQELEALYSFPVPQGAAVGEFTYWINGQAVTAEVVEKGRAKQIYQQQKEAGNNTALVEQDSYKTFDVKVFPIAPQDQVKIRLVYLQQEQIDTGLGRYVYPLEEGGVDEARNSFWTRNDTVQERFSFTMDIRSSYPLDGVRLPAHPDAQYTQIDDQQWQISIGSNNNEQENLNPAPESSLKLDKDILVYWRHKPDLPGSVDLISYREPGKKQGTFKLTLTPGDDLALNQGQRDWIFVLDKSGSMAAKYQTLIEGVRQALAKLPANDRFRIITFNNQAQDITSGYQAVTAENVENSLNKLQAAGVSGGTNLYSGIEKAIKKLDADRASAIVLVSDGVANVGVTEKKSFLKLLDKKDVRLYSFIMGNSANRPLLEGMSNISNGFYAAVSNSDDLMGQVMLATSKMTHQAMRDIKLNIDGIKISELSHEDFNSLYRGQQLTFFGHYYGQGAAEVELTGKVNGQKVSYKTEIDFNNGQTLHPELERLWAYSKIKQLEKEMDYLGESADSKQAIQELAVKYGLVTNYTSLLVVEEQVFEQFAIKQTNKQRVAKEQAAQQQKIQQPPADNRADHKQPMFSSPKPSFAGGGGAVHPLWMLLLVMLKLPSLLRKQSKKA
ncbi:VIT and vWA domain-containing protein [Psychromonas aquimarina]|uniref:VIT and vWA domain-containing protein n=1 Tax=Psychromonas aquimarina TaxID=444919 RepID=UPI0004086272|nr:VIT and VWA domain-containing protein [Psychromonas aquimarina]